MCIRDRLYEIFGGDDKDTIFGGLALYRGLHFDTGWNNEEYERTSNSDMTGKTTYSLGASELGGSKHPYDAFDVSPQKMEEAVATIKKELEKFMIEKLELSFCD